MIVGRRDAWPSPEQQRAKLDQLLREQFHLDPLPPFSIIVEGPTDRAYLLRAAELFEAEHGIDLLATPKSMEGDLGGHIAIVAPGRPGAPHRGGTAQSVRLAEALRPYVFTLEIFSGVVFVFDHDDEGLRAQSQIEESGYKKDRNSISLDPREHPGSCAAKQVTIEDLLSLPIQQKYFELGTAWCSVDYEAGLIKRYKWGIRSKGDLCQFVCRNGTLNDLEEVSRIILRARGIFGIPTR